ncbi:MAG TPA: SulP family inorganic anion transporter [Fimbriimonas sp.]
MAAHRSEGANPPVPLIERVLPFVPVFRHYTPEKAKRDFFAALTVALFTIPQAMAYAIIAGFSPAAGIVTAVVASILGAAFGSSEFLINGPTNAISVMIAANVALLASTGDPKGMVILLTLMIGAGQLVASLFKAGAFTRFVSEPVLTGFTAGAGIYIAVNQLPSALGLETDSVVQDLFGWVPPHNPLFDYLRTMFSLAEVNTNALGVALSTFVMVRALQWLEPRLGHRMRIPAPFLTVVVVGIGAYLLGLGDPSAGADKIKLVRDIEPVTRSLPRIVWPELSWERLSMLAAPAFAIGLLGAVEAIAIGKSLAAKAGHRFDANRQLIGEGACNVGAALFGGFAASGSFTRTAVNYEAGAVTRVSCIFSGLLVMAIVILFAPLANYIPTAVLAGMLIHIGLKLVNVGRMKLIIGSTIADRQVLVATFVSVLLVPDLAYALFIGVTLSIFNALRRAEGFKLVHLVENENGLLVEHPLEEDRLGRIVTLDLQGELFFAAAEELEQRLKSILSNETLFMVLRLQQAYNMDVTFAEAMDSVGAYARARGGRLILSGVRPGMYGTLERAGVVRHLGEEAVIRHEPTLLGSTHRAIDLAESLAAEPREPARASD